MPPMTVQDIVERAGRSRENRRQAYAWYRMWWNRGSGETGAPAVYNKIKAHIDLYSSYLYAPESTRFSAWLPPEHREKWGDTLDVVRDVFTDEWSASGADVTFADAVEWSCIFGCAPLKIVPEGKYGVSLQYVFPGDVGVLREDVKQIARQTAIVHWFYYSMSEVRRFARGLPNAEHIIGLAEQRAISEYAAGTHSYPKFMSSIIVSSVDAGTVRGVTPMAAVGDDAPEVQEPVVELCEVWRLTEYEVNGERLFDFEVVTMLDREELVARRNVVLPAQPEFGFPGEDPFVIVSPQPRPDYIWGQSSIFDLYRLQDRLEERTENIDELLRRQLNPPATLIGFPNPAEAMKQFAGRGGYLSSPVPSAKAEVNYPKFPENMWQYLSTINDNFADVSGIPSVLGAASQEGVRSGQQLMGLASIASGGKLRKRALQVEDALSVAATKFLHAMQRRNDQPYQRPNGQSFLLSQLPATIKILVSAHSSSPVFAEATMAKADRLLQAGAIDLPTYVELVDPPRMESLREKAKGLQEAKAQMAERVLRVQEEKYLRGKARNPA